MRAFADLDTERPIGMGVGPIPWSKVREYADAARLRGPARVTFEVCVRALDRAVLAEQAAKQPKGASHGG